jgi:hypothetical protein
MAEVLVVAQDRPVEDSTARWYEGMPVVVKPDGWKWGSDEGPPRFVIMRFPKLSVEECEDLLDLDDEDDPDDDPLDPAKQVGRKMYARRKVRFKSQEMAVAKLAPGWKRRVSGINSKFQRDQMLEAVPRDAEKRPGINLAERAKAVRQSREKPRVHRS